MRPGFLKLLLIISFTCASGAISDPVNRLESHKPLLDRPIHQRITSDPMILNYLKKLDKNPEYTFYTPTASEMKIIRESFASLPPISVYALETGLTGYCFIKGFQGGGITEWIKGPDDRFYYFIAFNPDILTKTLNEAVNAKEQTCFSQDRSGASVAIDLGRGGSGFQYILLHESVHAVDYMMKITPYTDSGFKKAADLRESPTPFTRGIWTGYSRTSEEYRFREKVTFYGFGGGPKLLMAEAPEVYNELARSPFVTLYSTLNWAEDLAEYVTFYHIVKKMKRPFVITVRDKKGLSVSHEPFKNSKVTAREKQAEFFYSSLRK